MGQSPCSRYKFAGHSTQILQAFILYSAQTLQVFAPRAGDKCPGHLPQRQSCLCCRLLPPLRGPPLRPQASPAAYHSRRLVWVQPKNAMWLCGAPRTALSLEHKHSVFGPGPPLRPAAYQGMLPAHPQVGPVPPLIEGLSKREPEE